MDIEYNTKVTQKDFDGLQTERENRQNKRKKMIESKSLGGNIGALQERLRISQSLSESKVLKSGYKSKDARKNSSGINDTFKARGIDKTQNIGYANYEYYVPTDNVEL